MRTVLRTSLAPILWGATYVVFTETLPTTHPLTVAALRCVPAGAVLLLVAPAPRPRAWTPLIVLGALNIGVFSALLFIAASRLPGGIAAVLIATQPLFATVVAWPALGHRPAARSLVLGVFGILGVGILVGPSHDIDLIGIAAAILAALSRAAGTVLVKRWRDVTLPFASAGWQLLLGGLFIAPIAWITEGAPPAPTAFNVVGLALLIFIGTAFAFALWIEVVGTLGEDAAFLGLLSPLVATFLGVLVLDESFRGAQIAGMALVLLAAIGGAFTHRFQPQETS